jgi:hypothetical protein
VPVDRVPGWSGCVSERSIARLADHSFHLIPLPSRVVPPDSSADHILEQT